MSQEWERDTWRIKKPASFRKLQEALDEQRTYNMANIPPKAILNQQLEAPVPGGDLGWQWGFLRLPIQPVAFQWERWPSLGMWKDVVSFHKEQQLVFITGWLWLPVCMLYVWGSLGEEMFPDVQTESLACDLGLWPLIASPVTSKKSLTTPHPSLPMSWWGLISDHPSAFPWPDPTSPAPFQLLMGWLLQASTHWAASTGSCLRSSRSSGTRDHM